MLAFVFDFVTIPSYLGFVQTQRFAARCGVAVEWLPMRREVRPVPPAKAQETVGERHIRVRAEYEAADQRRYAEWLGVDLKREPAPVDAQPAIDGMLIANAANRGESFAEVVLRAYWTEGAALDASAIEAALGTVGLERDNSESIEALRVANEARIDELGLFNTPGYHVAGQVFLGRQHLPMIERILAGGSFD